MNKQINPLKEVAEQIWGKELTNMTTMITSQRFWTPWRCDIYVPAAYVRRDDVRTLLLAKLNVRGSEIGYLEIDRVGAMEEVAV